jgi:hypothetical protein
MRRGLLEQWATNVDRCHQWDSNYGAKLQRSKLGRRRAFTISWRDLDPFRGDRRDANYGT